MTNERIEKANGFIRDFKDSISRLEAFAKEFGDEFVLGFDYGFCLDKQQKGLIGLTHAMHVPVMIHGLTIRNGAGEWAKWHKVSDLAAKMIEQTNKNITLMEKAIADEMSKLTA